jgi:uncharacterized protein YjcR
MIQVIRYLEKYKKEIQGHIQSIKIKNSTFRNESYFLKSDCQEISWNLTEFIVEDTMLYNSATLLIADSQIIIYEKIIELRKKRILFLNEFVLQDFSVLR